MMEGVDRYHSGKGALVGLLIGGLIGLGLGLLAAPEEGQRLRRRLAYRLDRLADRVRTLVSELGPDDDDSEARRSSEALVADVQKQADQIMHDVDALIDEMKRHETKRSASS